MQSFWQRLQVLGCRQALQCTSAEQRGRAPLAGKRAATSATRGKGAWARAGQRRAMTANTIRNRRGLRRRWRTGASRCRPGAGRA